MLKCIVLHAIEHCCNTATTECLLITVVIECGSRTFLNFKLISSNFTTMVTNTTLNTRLLITFYFAWEGYKVLWGVYLFVSLFVCLSDCLSAHISWKLHHQTSLNLLCLLPMAMAQSCSDGVVIRCVLPVCEWRHVLYNGPMMHRVLSLAAGA